VSLLILLLMISRLMRLLVVAENFFPTASGAPCNGQLQSGLKFGVENDRPLADRICCHNTRYAEHWGYLTEDHIDLFSKVDDGIVFYDSVCGVPLFIAPRGRSFKDWKEESLQHGWPSFRPEETVTENVIFNPGGEMASVCGTHLGHNLPDHRGDRYCIDLVCVAGNPITLSTPAPTPVDMEPMITDACTAHSDCDSHLSCIAGACRNTAACAPQTPGLPANNCNLGSITDECCLDPGTGYGAMCGPVDQSYAGAVNRWGIRFATGTCLPNTCKNPSTGRSNGPCSDDMPVVAIHAGGEGMRGRGVGVQDETENTSEADQESSLEATHVRRTRAVVIAAVGAMVAVVVVVAVSTVYRRLRMRRDLQGSMSAQAPANPVDVFAAKQGVGGVGGGRGSDGEGNKAVSVESTQCVV
jgi:peptide methionine sulfoxide reductase MsrB